MCTPTWPCFQAPGGGCEIPRHEAAQAAVIRLQTAGRQRGIRLITCCSSNVVRPDVVSLLDKSSIGISVEGLDTWLWHKTFLVIWS